jgi:hypothetical protein
LWDIVVFRMFELYMFFMENVNYLLCSNCFIDEGLKYNAIFLGVKNLEICKNCKSITGNKLTSQLIDELCNVFFVRGSFTKTEFGGAPIIQYNQGHNNISDIDLLPKLRDDMRLIEEAIQVVFFHYGPRLWMIGEIEPLKSLQNILERKSVISEIIKKYPIVKLSTEEYFYRLRINPEFQDDYSQYDSSPDKFLGKKQI